MKLVLTAILAGMLLTAGCTTEEGGVTTTGRTRKTAPEKDGEALWARACAHSLELLGAHLRGKVEDGELIWMLAVIEEGCPDTFRELGPEVADRYAACVLEARDMDSMGSCETMFGNFEVWWKKRYRTCEAVCQDEYEFLLESKPDRERKQFEQEKDVYLRRCLKECENKGEGAGEGVGSFQAPFSHVCRFRV